MEARSLTHSEAKVEKHKHTLGASFDRFFLFRFVYHSKYQREYKREEEEDIGRKVRSKDRKLCWEIKKIEEQHKQQQTKQKGQNGEYKQKQTTHIHFHCNE